MGDRTYNFDILNQLSDNAAAYTADGYAQKGGADAVINLGGNQNITPVQQARMDAWLVVDVTAITISATDERYRLQVMGCNDPAFASGVRELASIELGKGSAGVPATQVDSTAGRYELGFSTEQDDVKYQYIKLYNNVTGASPSIAYHAFVAVIPEP